MNSWILAISYSVHLLATAVWAAGLLFTCLLTIPAWQVGGLSDNGWLQWQKRLAPWLNSSLMLLLISGFYQMTNDPNYSGFLAIDSVWAWAMLVKHIAYLILLLATFWMQFGLYPAMERTAVLAQKRPRLAAQEQVSLKQRERRLLALNMTTAVIILICTGVATAV